MINSLDSDSSAERGFSLLELLVALLISTVLLGNITSTIMTSTTQHHDQKVRTKTNENAHLLLDTLSYEIRMLGTGMPLGQEDFDMLDATLNNAPLPILTTASGTYLQIRLDEVGTDAIVVASYTPSFTSRDVDVDDASEFSVGDTVYISNKTNGEKGGLQSTITAINGNTVTIDNSYNATPGVVFDVGSMMHKVDTITLDSTPSGITRQRGAETPIVLLPRSTIAISYFDENGNTLTPPLSVSQIRNDLMRVRIQISVDSRVPLKSGATYTADTQQDIFLRNLHLARL